MSIPEIEINNVLNVYDEISSHFDDTRYCIWNCVANFLQKFKNNSLKGIEIGCGSGKNFKLNNNMIGIDNSQKMVDTCIKKKIQCYFSRLL